jgi:hypothetical protein
MAVTTYRRNHALRCDDCILALGVPFLPDLHSRLPRRLEATQTQVALETHVYISTCEIPPTERRWTEYHLGLWQDQLPSPMYSANAAIPTGDVPRRPPRFSRPNSNCRSESCSSRQKRMFSQPSCAGGAKRTGIGSTSQNGCLGRGTLP